MTRFFVLDTSVLIDPSRLPDDAEASISVISLSELQRGVLLTEDAQERARRLQRVAAIESGFDALPVTPRIARIHAMLGAAVVTSGRQPRRRAMDLLIAATAVDEGAELLTLNPDDFRGVEAFVRVVHPDDLAA